MENSLKWVLSNIVSGQITSDAQWKYSEVFFIENLTYFFIPKGGRRYSHTNSFNFAMTPASQDDHLTAGAWAARVRTCTYG